MAANSNNKSRLLLAQQWGKKLKTALRHAAEWEFKGTSARHHSSQGLKADFKKKWSICSDQNLAPTSHHALWFWGGRQRHVLTDSPAASVCRKGRSPASVKLTALSSCHTCTQRDRKWGSFRVPIKAKSPARRFWDVCSASFPQAAQRHRIELERKAIKKECRYVRVLV